MVLVILFVINFLLYLTTSFSCLMIRRGKDIKNVFFHDSKCGEIRYTVIFAGRQVCGRNDSLRAESTLFY